MSDQKIVIPLLVKKKCVELCEQKMSAHEIYNNYFLKECSLSKMSFRTFRNKLSQWKKKDFSADLKTLLNGTYDGYVAHDATVQISGNGTITQAWIKQKKSDIEPIDIINLVSNTIEKYEYHPTIKNKSEKMLEIPLYDMHWGENTFDGYEELLNNILDIINLKAWDIIFIPFGQDWFHNDSIVNGVTTKGTCINKIDMKKAVQESQKFIYAIVDLAIKKSNSVQINYSPGNHDQSMSWMFIEILKERYGAKVVDDSIRYRKCITYGSNAIMYTHGCSKSASASNLSHIFASEFALEYANAKQREIHAGHLHQEMVKDIYGTVARRLSTSAITDKWADENDYVCAVRRTMLFEWSKQKLDCIYYI